MSLSTRILDLVPAAIALWSLIGAVGTAIAYRTRDRTRARRNALSILVVWITYFFALILTALVQPQRIVPAGKSECFSSVCYTVAEVRSIGEFKGQGGGNLVQISVRLTNSTTKTKQVQGLEAYLIDDSGHTWPETQGLGGVPLTLRLVPRASVVSQPIFRVQGSPHGLGLVLTRGFHGSNWLVPGDTDSPFHRRTLLALP